MGDGMSSLQEMVLDQQRAEKRAERRGFAWLVVIPFVILGATASHLCAFFAGDYMATERIARMESEKPKPTIPAPAAALTQWSCSAQERREYLNVCIRRMHQETRP